MKKKGFTLIELLAVIVILAIIALIATPLVLNTIDKAKKGAAKASALEYMNAVERYMVEAMLDTTMPQLQPGVEYQLSNKKYEVVAVADPNTVYINDLINIKGDKPEKGYLIVNKQGTVEEMKLVMNKYPVECSNSKCEVTGDKEEENNKEEYKAYSIGDAVTIDGVGYHVIKASSSNDEYVTLLRDESIGTMAFDDDSTDYETSTLKAYLNSTYKDTFGDKKSLIKEITLIDFGSVTYVDDFTFTLDGIEGTYAYIYNNLNDKSWLTNNSFYTKTVSNYPQTCESVVENNGIKECVNPIYTHLYIQVTDNTVHSANYLGTVISSGTAGTTAPSTEPRINVRPVIVVSKDAIKAVSDEIEITEDDYKEVANALIAEVAAYLVTDANASTYTKVEGIAYKGGSEPDIAASQWAALEIMGVIGENITALGNFYLSNYKIIPRNYTFTLENGKINNGTITFNDSTVINVVNGKIAS